MRGITQPFRPPRWMQEAMDWTVTLCTVEEPEHCPRVYDYWFAGFMSALFLTIVF